MSAYLYGSAQRDRQLPYQDRNFQGQSPLYYIILSGWIEIFGTSEITIRLLSLACLCLTTLHPLSLGLVDSISISSAFLCCFIFLCQDSTLLALSARPYALGILFSVLSIKSLLKFLKMRLPAHSTH